MTDISLSDLVVAPLSAGLLIPATLAFGVRASAPGDEASILRAAKDSNARANDEFKQAFAARRRAK
jgi:hypothetical protein